MSRRFVLHKDPSKKIQEKGIKFYVIDRATGTTLASLHALNEEMAASLADYYFPKEYYPKMDIVISFKKTIQN